MRISFYTIDDFRLGHDPKGVTGWRLSRTGGTRWSITTVCPMTE